MTRRCFFGTSWSCGTLGWALQAVWTWMGWREKDEAAIAPPGGPAAVWLAAFFKVWFSVTFDLILELVFALNRYCAPRTNGAHFLHPLHPILLLINREAGINVSTPNQDLWVNLTEFWSFQFSCVLDGSTSLWPKGSASVLHLLAGLSCATAAVSLWSSGGSREPFLSWLGAVGWLQPLELLSGMGGGASTIGCEGPLDWTDSGFTGFAGGNWAPSSGWFKLWLVIPVAERQSKWFVYN